MLVGGVGGAAGQTAQSLANVSAGGGSPVCWSSDAPASGSNGNWNFTFSDRAVACLGETWSFRSTAPQLRFEQTGDLIFYLAATGRMFPAGSDVDLLIYNPGEFVSPLRALRGLWLTAPTTTVTMQHGGPSRVYGNPSAGNFRLVLVDANGCGVDTSAWTWDGSVRDGDGVCQPPAVSTPAPPPPPAPSAVSGIEVTPLDGALHVDWRPASGEVSQYRIRVMRETADGLEVVRQLYTEAAVTELRVENLSNGVTYAVTVAALNGRDAGSEGPTSEPVRGSPAGVPDPDPPSAVSGLEVTPLDGALHVDWRPASGEVSQYRIRVMRETADGLEVVRQLHTDAEVTELLVENLSNGVTYAVTVAALNAGSEGPPSEPVRGSPVGDPDPDPQPEPDPDPVPALPFAGSAALAGLLYSWLRRARAARCRG